MLKFNNGYFGACICVLALLGTAISGFVLNVDQESREVTRYSYVADVSGLFSYSDAPEYISYNPSTNYVGYDDYVTYTNSSSANNYRYLVEQGGTETLTNFTLTSSDENAGNYGAWANNNDIRFASLVNGNDWYILKDVKATKLSTILTRMNVSDYESVELDLSQGTYPVFIDHGNWTYYADYGQSTGYYLKYLSTMDDVLPTHLSVDVTSYITKVYRGTTLLYTDSADNIGVIAWYSYRDMSQVMTPIDRSTSVTFSGTGTEPSTYAYMQPNAGVKASSFDDWATWSNGYQNSQIDVKIIKDGDNSSYAQSDIFLLTGGSIGFNYFSGKINYTYLGHDYELGTWLGVGMRLDAMSGNIILTPTNNTDLTATVEPTDYSITIEGAFTPGDITSFQVKRDSSAPYHSMKFQVTDTMVFLNTYNTVMIDPSLEITDWFPSYTDYRLNFYSFALIGDSITINGQVCPVNRDNGTFTFENVAGFQITKKLENFYITFLDGHTYITFANDGSEYDLGETTDTTVSFEGMWYFTTGLWQSYEGTETYWNWDLSGFQASAGECLLIFLGIIGAGVIIYIVWGRGKLGFLDWLVIIFAVFLATAFLGF